MNIIPKRFYLDDFFDDFVPTKNDMKCDIYERGDKYHIDIDLPGYEKDEIKLECKNGYLTVSALKKDVTEEKDNDKNYFRRERTYSKMERSFSLGDINEEDIKASFKNGTLNIVIPKKEQIESKKFIEIE